MLKGISNKENIGKTAFKAIMPPEMKE
jgi:hypothetical protein